MAVRDRLVYPVPPTVAAPGNIRLILAVGREQNMEGSIRSSGCAEVVSEQPPLAYPAALRALAG
jgi:hypothetical protein